METPTVINIPDITIFVRHSADCESRDEGEFWKRCRCRKHLRWTQNGKQYRKKAGTRSWTEAENKKRDLEDQLSGRSPVVPKEQPESKSKIIADAVELFIQDKRNQGITEKVIGKYTRELARLRDFCESHNAITVQLITRELLTQFCATWPKVYESSYTRAKVRERLRSFLRYCYEAQWIERIPQVPKIKIDEPETMPLTRKEYESLLDAIYVTMERKDQQEKVHALIQLMRWSGLSIRDALTLERGEIRYDQANKVNVIETARQKTGVHVCVPIPPEVAQDVLAVLNGNPKFVFWSGNGEQESITKNWAKYYIAPLFKAAKIPCDGHMMSHRLRDTFAVDLLEKGVPLEEVSKLLGHKSIKTTERHYAKWSKGGQDRLVRLVTATW